MTVRQRLAELKLHFTARELDVIEAVAKGMNNRDSALGLKLQELSIKNLVSVVMIKLNVDNRVKVALIARGIEPDSD